jgi:hypothetical protein
MADFMFFRWLNQRQSSRRQTVRDVDGWYAMLFLCFRVFAWFAIFYIGLLILVLSHFSSSALLYPRTLLQDFLFWPRTLWLCLYSTFHRWCLLSMEYYMVSLRRMLGSNRQINYRWHHMDLSNPADYRFRVDDEMTKNFGKWEVRWAIALWQMSDVTIRTVLL